MASERPPAEFRALTALSASGVRWAALRDDPLAPGASDIDLLVHPDDARRVDNALASEGFARLRTWRHGDHRFHIAYDPDRDVWTKVDEVRRFTYRSGHELPDAVAEAALARVIREGTVVRLNPDDEFWALLFHCVLDRGDVAARHSARLCSLAQADPAGPLRDALGSSKVSGRAVELARAGDVAGLLTLGRLLRGSLTRQSLAQRVRQITLRGASPLIRAVRSPGLSVAVLGPDGAGKSTLVHSLKGTFPIPVRTHYVGLYGDRARRARRFGLAGQLAMAWGVYVAAGIDRRRGRIVVFDRYGYDALLPAPNGHNSRRRRLRRSLLGGLAPRPDLVVFLDAPAASLRARKPEHEDEEFELRRSGYAALSQHLANRGAVELIDASADAAFVRRRVTGLIWDTFMRLRAGVEDDTREPRYGHGPAPREGLGAHGDQ